MEVIEYLVTQIRKSQIAQKYLVPKQINNHELKKRKLICILII